VGGGEGGARSSVGRPATLGEEIGAPRRNRFARTWLMKRYRPGAFWSRLCYRLEEGARGPGHVGGGRPGWIGASPAQTHHDAEWLTASASNLACRAVCAEMWEQLLHAGRIPPCTGSPYLLGMCVTRVVRGESCKGGLEQSRRRSCQPCLPRTWCPASRRP
jgi:hypothetical protein